MPVFPTPWTVQHVPRVLGARDARNAVTETYGAPVDVAVYAWYPTQADAQSELLGASPVQRGLEVLGPSWPGVPKDRVVIGGVTFEQVGYPEDFDHGPFGFQPGVRVHFVRVEESE